MTDMRMTSEQKKDFSTPSLGPEAPEYPHGLKIYLGPEELKKLGFMDAPAIDSEFKIKGTVKVVEVSSEEEKGHRIELQITDLELSSSKSDNKDASQVLYGEA